MAKFSDKYSEKIRQDFTSCFNLICEMKKENDDNDEDLSDARISQTLKLMEIEATKDLTKALNKVRPK